MTMNDWAEKAKREAIAKGFWTPGGSEKREAKPEPEPEAEPAKPVANFTWTGDANESTWNKTDDRGVRQTALDRQDLSDAIMRKHKHAVANTAVTRGKILNGSGRSMLAGKSEEWANQARTIDNIDGVLGLVDAEKRDYTEHDIRDARMLVDDGRLLLGFVGMRRSEYLPCNLHTQASIVQYLGTPGFGFANMRAQSHAWLTPVSEGGFTAVETAEAFNRFMVERVSKHTFQRGSERKRLWTRLQGGERQCLTMTSLRHSSDKLDVSEFLRLVKRIMEQQGLDDMRGEVVYNPDDSSVSIASFLMPDTIVDFAAGDVFKTGFLLRTNDTKGGSYRGDGLVMRNLCLNLGIVQRSKRGLFSVTHSADAAKIQRVITRGLGEAGELVSDFADLWGILRANKVHEVDSDGEPLSIQDVLRNVAADVKLTGVKRDVLVEAVLRGFEAEPGETYADVYNAVTRAHFAKEIDSHALAVASGELLPILAKRAQA